MLFRSLQFVDGRYYTDGNGIEHADDGTTIEEAIAAGDTNCKYIYTPGYSPENVPAGNNENSIESLAYNTTMDISASRDTLFMARAIIDVINPTDKSSLLSKWADFESKIPEYVYASTGELQEWASPNLGDRHTHRHVSHAYVAWPGYESQTDDALRVGVIKAMDARSAAYGGQEASESHGPTHKALVEARLKNVEGLEGVLKYLLTNNYQYSTMMTSHNANLSSTYCTDSAFGIMGAINESLLYSNTGIVEILPTLLSSSDNGSVSGLRARCNTECDITWDRYADKASVTLTSDEDNNTVKVRCGIAWNSATIGGKKQNIHNDDDGMPYVEVVLGKGKAVTIDFTLTSDQSRITISTDTDISNSISNDESLSFAGKYTFSREEAKNLSWHVVYAANDREALEATISADGTVSLANNAKGNTYKVYAVSTEGTKSNEVMFHVKSDSTETFTVNRMFLDDDLGISIVNDAIEKNIVLIWSAYDASGKLVAMSQRECKLGANEFKSVVVPLGWELGEYRSTLYIWDKESLKPYTKQVVIR